MAGLLKRLSTRLGDSGAEPAPRSLASSTSFSDFSLGMHQDFADDGPGRSTPLGGTQAAPGAPPSADFASVVGSAPAGSAGFAGLAKSMALRIPRSSVSHLLEQRLRTTGVAASEPPTPRSSMDVGPPSPAAPPPASPRYSSRWAGSPSSTASGSVPSADEPASPRSPRTPGGRRRRSGKIDGMDYYEFCELIRSSSL